MLQCWPKLCSLWYWENLRSNPSFCLKKERTGHEVKIILTNWLERHTGFSPQFCLFCLFNFFFFPTTKIKNKRLSGRMVSISYLCRNSRKANQSRWEQPFVRTKCGVESPAGGQNHSGRVYSNVWEGTPGSRCQWLIRQWTNSSLELTVTDELSILQNIISNLGLRTSCIRISCSAY